MSRAHACTQRGPQTSPTADRIAAALANLDGGDLVSLVVMRATVEEGDLVMDRLFIGSKVFDGRGTLLDGHGVMVREGRIAEVAPADQFAGFTGVSVDTTWCHLVAGLDRLPCPPGL